MISIKQHVRNLINHVTQLRFVTRNQPSDNGHLIGAHLIYMATRKKILTGTT